MTHLSQIAGAAVAAVALGVFAVGASAGTGASSCTAGACGMKSPAVASTGSDALTLQPVHLLDVETAGDSDGGWYAAITGGYTFPDDAESEGFDIPLDEGFSVTGAIGTDLGAIRVEGEGSYRENDLDVAGIDGDISAISVMANVLYDHPIADAVDVYVGAGVGAAFVDFEATGGGLTTDDDDTVLAYQFLAGLALYTSDNFAITGGYRLWTTSDLEFEGADVDAPLVHTAEIGVRFDF